MPLPPPSTPAASALGLNRTPFLHPLPGQQWISAEPDKTGSMVNGPVSFLCFLSQALLSHPMYCDRSTGMRRYRLDSVSGGYAHALQWLIFRKILALLAVALPEARDALRSSYCLGRLFHFVKFCALTDTRDWHVENLAQIFRIGNRVEFTKALLFFFGPEGFHAGYPSCCTPSSRLPAARLRHAEPLPRLEKQKNLPGPSLR